MGDLSKSQRTAVIAAARQAAADMARVIGDGVESRIATTSRSFEILSGLLDRLAGEVENCGGSDCMGRKVEGMRFWVTQDRLKAEEARNAALTQENGRLARENADLNAALIEARRMPDEFDVALAAALGRPREIRSAS